MFELLWDKKNDLDLTNIYGDANTAQFFAQEFFNIKDENNFEEDEAPDFVLTPKKTAEDIESEIPNIVHSDFDYFKYSEMDGSNNRFMRKQKNTDKTNNGFNAPSEEVKKEVEKEINLFSDNTEELPF
jgi:hypothetical protein